MLKNLQLLCNLHLSSRRIKICIQKRINIKYKINIKENKNSLGE